MRSRSFIISHVRADRDLPDLEHIVQIRAFGVKPRRSAAGGTLDLAPIGI